MKKQQTAVEWLAEKYDYVNWMRNRDEISASIADEWRKHFLEQAKEMEKEQIIASHINGNVEYTVGGNYWKVAEQYYNETYGYERNTKSI